jgi:hypothetical protein
MQQNKQMKKVPTGEGNDTQEEEGVDTVQASVQEGGSLAAIDDEGSSVGQLGDVRVGNLRHGPTDSGKHSKTTVLELGLAVLVKGVKVLGEIERIEALVANHKRVLEDRARLKEVVLDCEANRGVATLHIQIQDKPR